MLSGDLSKRGSISLSSSSEPISPSSSEEREIKQTAKTGNMVGGQDVNIADRAGSSKLKAVVDGSLSRLVRVSSSVSSLRRRISQQTIRTHVGDVFGPAKLQTLTLPYRKRAVLTSTSESTSESNDGRSKFDACLKKPYGFEALMTYCEEKHSEENIHFLLSLNELKTLITKGKTKEAQEIFNQIEMIFLKENAHLEVNLFEEDKKALLSYCKDISSTEFHEALTAVEHYIKSLIGSNIDQVQFEMIREGYVKK